MLIIEAVYKLHGQASRDDISRRKKKAQVFWNELIDFVKKQKVTYTLTSIAPNWCYITAVWVAKIDSADCMIEKQVFQC